MRPVFVLAIDTSSAAATVCLLEGTSLRAERSLHHRGKHGDVLLGLVASVLEDAGLRVADVGLFAVGLGPGGFSSLRVGLATVKGLALAHGGAIVGVSSAQAIARGVAPAGVVAVFTDAQRGEVYGSAYDFSAGTAVERCAPFLARPEVAGRVVAEALGGAVGAAVLGGDALGLYEAEIAGSFAGARIVPALLAAPRAALVGLEGLAAFEARGGDDLAGLEPMYVRPSDAALPAKPLRVFTPG